jgi:peptide deformylase
MRIITVNDPDGGILREKSPFVTFSEQAWAVNILIPKMAAIMEAETNPPALGLAAVQIGVKKRAILVRESLTSPTIAMVNPVITGRSSEMVGSIEGCMSIPGEHYIVRRWKRIHVRYRDGHKVASGLLAFVLQHEIDHLGGVLISDIGVRFEPTQGDEEKSQREVQQALAEAKTQDYGLKH